MENSTEMVEPVSTLSPVGVVLTTVNGAGGGAVVAEAEGLWGRGMAMNPTAANARAAPPTAQTQIRVFLPLGSFLRECFPEAMATGIVPVVFVPQALREAQIAAVIWSSRPGSITLVPIPSRT